MKTNYFTWLLFIPLLLLTGCIAMDIEYQFSVNLYNYSGHDIVPAVYRDNVGSLFCIDGEFPESFCTEYGESGEVVKTFAPTELILKDNEKAEMDGWHGDTRAAWFYYVPNDTVAVYIFHADTLSSHPWEEIRSTQQVLACYYLTSADLQHLRGNTAVCDLYFPPTPEMKQMKMWPSYEEILSHYEVKTFSIPE